MPSDYWFETIPQPIKEQMDILLTNCQLMAHDTMTYHIMGECLMDICDVRQFTTL